MCRSCRPWPTSPRSGCSRNTPSAAARSSPSSSGRPQQPGRHRTGQRRDRPSPRVSVDDAFTLIRQLRLRNYARRNNRRLSDVAHTITTNPASLPELAGPGTLPIDLRFERRQPGMTVTMIKTDGQASTAVRGELIKTRSIAARYAATAVAVPRISQVRRALRERQGEDRPGWPQ